MSDPSFIRPPELKPIVLIALYQVEVEIEDVSFEGGMELNLRPIGEQYIALDPERAAWLAGYLAQWAEEATK